MSKTYEKFLIESLETEAERLVQEALEDQDKMDILEMMLDEEVANTASAPGIAMVSDGEPVSPKYSQKQFGKGIWRRKKKTMQEGWSEKYKRSIDCSNPKGFSQKAHCQGRKKREDGR